MRPIACFRWSRAATDPPLVEHARSTDRAERPAAGRAGSDKRALRRGLDSTATAPRLRRELDSAASQAWLKHLDEARAGRRSRQRIGRTLSARQVYRYASNGMALRARCGRSGARSPHCPASRRCAANASRMCSPMPGRNGSAPNQLWNGQVNGVAATRGEGVVIGIIDTGINPTHPSFAATGGDGFTITNPRGHFYGLCTTGQAHVQQQADRHLRLHRRGHAGRR